MISEDLISFDLAKLLKEKGFNEDCYMVYRVDGLQLYCASAKLDAISNRDIDKVDDWVKNSFVCTCPTIQRVMKWIREVHNKHCDIGYDIDLEWFFQIVDLKETVEYDYPETKYYHAENETGFNTHEEACEGAIKYCLENLIDTENE